MRRETNSSGMGMAVAILAMLVVSAVLYIVSVGPAVRLCEQGIVSDEALEVVYTPLIVLANTIEPVETILSAYVELWAPPQPVNVR